MGPTSPWRLYAVGWLAYTLPFTLGNVAGGAMAGTAFEPFVTSVAVWALVVTALILLDDRSLGNQLIFAELNGENGGGRRRPGPPRRRRPAGPRRAARACLRPRRRDPGPSGTSGTRTPANDLRPRCRPGPQARPDLARGRGAGAAGARPQQDRIAETFLISENTVRGHVKHIYAKLGVHSKQELLDAFEGR